MKLSDQTLKMRIVYLTAAFSLIGFFLEIGPVGGIFPLVIVGLKLELPTLGFLAYLALAASAAIGLHLSEEEPTPKEEGKEAPPPEGPGEGGVGEIARVRPDLFQLRMLFTALGGYALLKIITLILMYPSAEAANVFPLYMFDFGFAFIGIGWFVLIQFMRWYAQQKRWIRLQDELVGGDVSRIVGAVLMLKPLYYFIFSYDKLFAGPLHTISTLLHLCVAAAAVILWLAKPRNLRLTIIGLGIVGGIIIILTIVLAVIERALTMIR